MIEFMATHSVPGWYSLALVATTCAALLAARIPSGYVWLLAPNVALTVHFGSSVVWGRGPGGTVALFVNVTWLSILIYRHRKALPSRRKLDHDPVSSHATLPGSK